jgi:hypothetical protein
MAHICQQQIKDVWKLLLFVVATLCGTALLSASPSIKNFRAEISMPLHKHTNADHLPVGLSKIYYYVLEAVPRLLQHELLCKHLDFENRLYLDFFSKGVPRKVVQNYGIQFLFIFYGRFS